MEIIKKREVNKTKIDYKKHIQSFLKKLIKFINPSQNLSKKMRKHKLPISCMIKKGDITTEPTNFKMIIGYIMNNMI